METSNRSNTVEVVGITRGNRGHSCDKHQVCRNIVCTGMKLRLQSVRIFNDQKDAIAVYSVSNGSDQCHVGFLPKHYIKDAILYDGVFVCVQEVYTKDDECIMKRSKHHKMCGCAQATIILNNSDKIIASPVRKKLKKEAGELLCFMLKVHTT